MIDFFDQIKNFAKATVDHILDGGKNVPDEVKQERLWICRGCDKYDQTNKKCMECGCFLEVKTKWASSECPLGLWGRFEEKVMIDNLTVNNDCGCGKK